MRRRSRFVGFAAIVVAIASAILAAGASPAAMPSGVYTGTIGGTRITLELGTHDEFLIDGTDDDTVTSPRPLTGTYYYDRVGIGIFLGGSVADDGRIELHEIRSKDNNESDARVGAKRWILRPSGAGFTGVWTQRKTTYPISLERIAPFERAGRYDRDAIAYRGKLRERALIFGPDVSHGETLSYRTATDARYDLATIQLRTFPDAAIRERANRALAADLDARADEAYDCLTNLAYGIGDFGPHFGMKSQMAFFSKNAVSLDSRGEIACAYAHPNYEVRPVTIDLRDGKALYRDLVKADPKACEGPGSASVFDRLDAGDFSYELRPNGLDLFPDLPYAIAVCARDVVIPSAVARTVLTPHYRALLP